MFQRANKISQIQSREQNVNFSDHFLMHILNKLTLGKKIGSELCHSLTSFVNLDSSLHLLS